MVITQSIMIGCLIAIQNPDTEQYSDESGFRVLGVQMVGYCTIKLTVKRVG